jgi:hypothetical protein
MGCTAGSSGQRTPEAPHAWATPRSSGHSARSAASRRSSPLKQVCLAIQLGGCGCVRGETALRCSWGTVGACVESCLAIQLGGCGCVSGELPCDTAKQKLRIVRGFGWEDRSRGRYATPADFPLHDGTPYRGQRVRRWGLGFVHRSRTIFCRAVPNRRIRSFFHRCTRAAGGLTRHGRALPRSTQLGVLAPAPSASPSPAPSVSPSAACSGYTCAIVLAATRGRECSLAAPPL